MSPWPQLASLFVLKEKRGDGNLTFQCLLCKLKEKLLSCSMVTNSNLRKHVKVRFISRACPQYACFFFVFFFNLCTNHNRSFRVNTPGIWLTLGTLRGNGSCLKLLRRPRRNNLPSTLQAGGCVESSWTA